MLERLGLDIALLENKAGNYIAPSRESAMASMASAVFPQNLRLFMPDPDGPNSYPVVTLTWVLLYDRYDDQKKARAIQEIFSWCLHEGQAYSDQLGYLPLPAGIVERSVAALNTVEP